MNTNEEIDVGLIPTHLLEHELKKRREKEKADKEKELKDSEVHILCVHCNGKGIVVAMDGYCIIGDRKCDTCNGTGRMIAYKVK